MVHVICVKHGTLYEAEYVNKLHRAVIRNSTVELDFACFTENRAGLDPAIRRHDLPRKDLQGWWHKLWLFSPEASACLGPGRILYLDLDTVIVGNIDAYLTFRGTFSILRDLYARDKISNNYGSAAMSWESGWGHFIWAQFGRDPAREMRGHGHGDQGYLMHVVPVQQVTFWQDYLPPNQALSFKRHIRDVNRQNHDPPLPPGASIVFFHGRPRPHEVVDIGWMKDHWV